MSLKTYHVTLTNIQWDMEGEEGSLPDTMNITVDTASENEDQVSDLAVDAASDQTGFCILNADASVQVED